MTDKIGHIKNPLTIIAIFAGLAEVGGTIVLPLLQLSTQAVYVWFLMIFPIFLVGVFFYVLYHKHHVLYAPSDFRDDASFKDILQSATPEQRLQKIEEETKEIEELEPAPQLTADVAEPIKALSILKNDKRARYLLTEELIFSKLAKVYGWEIERSAVERGVGLTYFDGVGHSAAFDVAIEIKYNTRLIYPRDLWIRTFDKIREFHSRLTSAQQNRFKLLVAVATEETNQERFDSFRAQIARIAASYPFKIEVEIYDFNALLTEFPVE